MQGRKPTFSFSRGSSSTHASEPVMFLIAALGNPGPGYEKNRHNVGFMVAEELRRRHGLQPFRSRFQGLFGDGLVCGRHTLLILPMTYMNRSGRSVAESARFYRVPVERILAIHDEVELPFGEVRLKQAGGLGGHNGLRSMEQSLGTRDFWRTRVGVGRPNNTRISLADHVLSDFDEPPERVLALIAAAADAVESWLAAEGVPCLV